MKRTGPLALMIAALMGSARFVHAHCPLCVAAMGAGILGARSLGFGDAVVGLFVGAFALSTGLWLNQKIRSRFIPFQSAGVLGASFALTILPLQPMATENLYLPVFLAGPAGSPLNQAYFTTVFLAAGIVGGIVSLGGLAIHNQIKKKYGRVLVPFQGIIVTIGLLLVTAAALTLWKGGV